MLTSDSTCRGPWMLRLWQRNQQSCRQRRMASQLSGAAAFTPAPPTSRPPTRQPPPHTWVILLARYAIGMHSSGLSSQVSRSCMTHIAALPHSCVLCCWATASCAGSAAWQCSGTPLYANLCLAVSEFCDWLHSWWSFDHPTIALLVLCGSSLSTIFNVSPALLS